ncbi:uncharacterized protein [Miscanthus floridulus]|uniref:uncharacterized protein n=1 Tax=Miscanthus floridulus TaxID=154761 RepID=UPI003457AEDF
MRAQYDPWFSEYLLRIGNGTEETIGDDYVQLPDDIVISYTDMEEAVQQLIQDVFPSVEENATSAAYTSSHAILSTKNDYVDRLNAMMIDRFPGEKKVYHSFDTVDDDSQNRYRIDCFEFGLKLKVNCLVILLRNLDPNNGFCSGTRLMVRALQDNAIDTKIVGRQHGQTIPNVGINLPAVFSHGQLCVALSRGVSRSTRILAKPRNDLDHTGA